MACVKCGQETGEERMFCARCLEGMAAYPVKPDVHVQLPARQTENAVRKQHSKIRRDTRDAKIAILQRQNRLLWVVVIVLLLAVAVLVARGALIPEKNEPGKNYTYVEPTT